MVNYKSSTIEWQFRWLNTIHTSADSRTKTICQHVNLKWCDENESKREWIHCRINNAYLSLLYWLQRSIHNKTSVFYYQWNNYPNENELNFIFRGQTKENKNLNNTTYQTKHNSKYNPKKIKNIKCYLLWLCGISRLNVMEFWSVAVLREIYTELFSPERKS